MKKIEAIIRPSRLDEVRQSLGEVGIRGMTVMEPSGIGAAGGMEATYRGSAYVVDLIPKVKLEIIVKDDQVPQVIEAIAAAARTGQSGDGKIVVTPVDDVIRIRTGQHGADAV